MDGWSQHDVTGALQRFERQDDLARIDAGRRNGLHDGADGGCGEQRAQEEQHHREGLAVPCAVLGRPDGDLASTFSAAHAQTAHAPDLAPRRERWDAAAKVGLLAAEVRRNRAGCPSVASDAVLRPTE